MNKDQVQPPSTELCQNCKKNPAQPGKSYCGAECKKSMMKAAMYGNRN